MATLRLAFLLTLGILVAWTVARADWEANMTCGNRTWILDLNRAPLWNAPPLPTHSQFRKTFANLPSVQPAGCSFSRILKWDWMLLEMLLCLWPVTIVFGFIYVTARTNRRDLVLHCTAGIGFGLTGAAVTWFILLLMFGGFGPPFPEFIGLGGLMLGLVFALCLWPPSSTLLGIDERCGRF
jgi:hypothetical protein